MKRPIAFAAILAIGALIADWDDAQAADQVAAPLLMVNDNGGWSWFEDERAIVDLAAGKLLVGSIANGAGAGGAARNGDVETVGIDLTTHAVSRFTLKDAFAADDHNSPALYRRTDGRYVAMYATHGADNLSRWRVSSNPGDASAWSVEQTINQGAGATYSNLYYLAADNGGQGRLYDFSRSVNYDPNVLISNDEGSTWTYGGKLLTEGTATDRPYVRYFSDGTKIHFMTTERHPRNFNNSIYYGYVQDGALRNATGAVVDANVLDATAVAPSALSTVFAANTVVDGASMQRAWTIDVASDASGRPVGVFQTRANGSNLDHRYFYSRWDGAQWQVNQIGYAGSYLYSAEDDYTGLIAIDPSHVDTIYLSSEVNPATKAQLIGADGKRHYELFRGQTPDGGATWRWTPITFNSTEDNVRPIMPKWDASHSALLWMRGDYATYTSYDTQIVALLDAPLTEPTSALKVDFGATGQQVLSGFFPFSRDPNATESTQTEMFASAYAGPGGQLGVSLAGTPQFRDRGDDVTGPIGEINDDYAFATGTMTLTLSNLVAGDYQLVLYAHDRDVSQPAFKSVHNGATLGQLTPTTGAAPSIGTASSRIQFHAASGSVTISLQSLSGGPVVLNGFELYAAPSYVAPPPPYDLNGDGALDLADYQQYIFGLHRDLSGLSPAAAFAMGDLNGDLKNNFADLVLFRQAYDTWNGAGAFAAAAAIPEPAAAGLLICGTLAGAIGKRVCAVRRSVLDAKVPECLPIPQSRRI